VWPVYDDSKLIEKDVTISLQINGKLRGTCVVSFDSSDETVIEAVQSIENYKKYVGENTPKKTIVIKNRLVNVVI
jgi:leucyl-tRNA synthetase